MQHNSQLASLMLELLGDHPPTLPEILGRGRITCELYESGGRTCVEALSVGDMDLLSPAVMLLACLGDEGMEALMPPSALTAVKTALIAPSWAQGRLMAAAAILSMMPAGGPRGRVVSGIQVDGKEYAI